MSLGSSTLNQLDRRINGMRGNVRSLEKELESLTSKINRLRQEQAGAFGSLAKIRLDAIRADSVAGQLNRVEHEAKNLLAERERALAALLQRIDAAIALDEQIEDERKRQADAVEAADEALSEQVDASDATLEADGQAMQLKADAGAAIERAEAANEKARQAREDREEKGQPYEADRLFMYLWNRKYGLPAYRAGNITRMLDGWVARLINYQNARPNYAMLLEIPQRLADHAEFLKQQAEDAVASFEGIREQRYRDDGVLELEAALNEAREALAKTDERLADQEKLLTSLENERVTYANGDDHFTRKALSLLIEELRASELAALRREAAETPTPQDDEITRRLGGLEQELEGLDKKADRQRVELQVVQDRLAELEGLRRKYRSNRFGDPHSKIRSGAKVKNGIDRYMMGAITVAQLWQIIQQQQYFKRTRTRHNWPGGWGGGSSSGGSFGGGGFGGGGFSSGGSFGGGGFSTGGGF